VKSEKANLKEILYRKDEYALLSKVDIAKLIIDHYGNEAEKNN
jgi:hypothetical protein